MPGQGVSSMFAFGEAFGLAKGVLAGLGIPVQSATPGRWKQALPLHSGQAAARAQAAATWRTHLVRAEAALIALWGLKGP